MKEYELSRSPVANTHPAHAKLPLSNHQLAPLRLIQWTAERIKDKISVKYIILVIPAVPLFSLLVTYAPIKTVLGESFWFYSSQSKGHTHGWWLVQTLVTHKGSYGEGNALRFIPKKSINSYPKVGKKEKKRPAQQSVCNSYTTVLWGCWSGNQTLRTTGLGRSLLKQVNLHLRLPAGVQKKLRNRSICSFLNCYCFSFQCQWAPLFNNHPFLSTEKSINKHRLCVWSRTRTSGV